MLDFWGYWWGPCRAMFPHERSLVKRLQNKPFVLLGVNSDSKRNDLKKVLEEEKITWRSFWAGGPSGPIPTHWQVQSWPSIFLIDHKGVIRQKYDLNPGEDILDKEIDQLVQEAETQESS
jgi:thiol-disulfide isomerase/thioredoxin